MTESIIESSAEVALDVISKAPIQVLHVDDDSGFLKAAKQILEMQGNFQVETASSVEEAKERMKQKPYDVIVSDYIMLGKDGLEFLKELRDSGNNTPFIMFTGKGREEVAIEALNLGADRYFNKIGSPEAVYGELTHGICRVVERRRAAEEVWKKEQRLRAVLTSSPDIITVSDLQGNITDCNDAAWKLMGFSSKEELIGKSAFEFIAEEDRERALENLKKTFEEGTIRNVEYTLLKKNGEEYIGELSASILKDSSGNQIGFVSVVRNITERKKTEDKISRQNEFLNSVLESLTHPFYVIDANDYTIKMANSAAHLGSLSEKTTCYGITHKRKKPCSSVKHPCPLEIVKKTKRPTIVEHIHYDKDGNVRIVEVHAYPIFDKDRNVVQIIEYSLDITERKKAEDALRESEERYRGIVELAPDGIITTNMKGLVTSVNSAFQKLTGYSEDEVVGKRFTKLGSSRARDIPKYMKLVSSILRGKTPSPIAFAFLCKDGTQRWGEVHASLLKKGGKKVGLQAILRDITERKKTREKLKVLNEKLGVVGKLTRHDARNKLSAVTMNVFLAKQKLAESHEALKHLDEIGSAVKQVERIFSFASIYEKLGAEELVYIDVGKAFDEAVSLFSDLQGIRVVNDCRGLTVLADSLLRQLVYNLVDNSLKHGERVSRIRLYYEEDGRDKLKLVYEDDGVGIPKAEKEKIFREDYRRDSNHALYLMRKMCEVYGWTIRETGKHGQGAQFTITVPRVGESGKANYNIH